MNKFFFALAGAVVILNAAWFVLFEARTRRSLASMSIREESHQKIHVSTVSELPTIAIENYPELTEIPGTQDATNLPEISEVDELTGEKLD